MECVIDAREQSLLHDCREMETVRSEALSIGDIMILHDKIPRLLIERKTVKDLVASLKDGRYHDQRARWKDFQQDFPQARVAVWIEGDLMNTEMEDIIRGALVNSLMRLQTIHGVAVLQWTTRTQFVRGLQLAMKKIEQDPTHLLPKEEIESSSHRILDLKAYKKTNATPDVVWRSVLTLVPGVAPGVSEKILVVFPTLVSFMTSARADLDDTKRRLMEIKISPRRRLGAIISSRICDLLLHGMENAVPISPPCES